MLHPDSQREDTLARTGDKPRHIVQITFGFLPAVTWGGPVKVVHANAAALVRRGHRVTVCASNLLDKQRVIEAGTFGRRLDGINAVYLDTRLIKRWPGTAGPTWLTVSAARRLWREIRAADVVHVHGTRNIVCLAGIYFARWQRKPLIIQPHGTLQQIVASIRLKKIYDALLLRRPVRQAARLIALTPTEAEQIAHAGGSPSRIEVVANGKPAAGIDRARVLGRFRRAHNIPNAHQIVLFLARINRKKGADLLVEAWARLDDSVRRSTTLIIAGPDDGQLAEVQALVARYGLQNDVIFPGLLEGDDVQAALVDADVFILPCRTDTFPMALVEACEAGTPIVVSETCEIAALLDGVAATITPVDPAAFAAAIAQLLADADLRARYRTGAAELMRTHFSVEAVAQRLETIYEDVIDGA